MREVRDEPRKGAVLTSERERPEKAGWEAGPKALQPCQSSARGFSGYAALAAGRRRAEETGGRQHVDRGGHRAAGTLTMRVERRLA
jgi:hypothetical protein